MQAASPEELLRSFDALQVEHEMISSEQLNDDGFYKTRLNEVTYRPLAGSRRSLH